jgi:thiol-disulfide isomerase/thioredoxin
MQYFTGISFYLARIRIIILALLFFPACAMAADIRITSENAIPAISHSDQQGKVQNVDFSKNKLTALHFWATWCQPCVIELPAVDAVQQKYIKQGFKIVALSLDGKNIDNVKKFYSENHISSLDILMDANMDSFQKLGLKGLPTTIFINSKGKEIARADGPLDWENPSVGKFIEERLK